MDDAPESAGEPRKRRPRYPGKYPKRYEQRYKEFDPQSHPAVHERLRAHGRTPAGAHVPVLADEVIAALKPTLGNVVVDCTVGYGGHAMRFCRHIGPGGLLVGFDLDEPELKRTKQKLLAAGAPLYMVHGNYAGVANALDKLAAADAGRKIQGADVIFADLGVSSMQVDDPSRGISYKNEGPLDMRMDRRVGQTGADVLAKISLEHLSLALWELADEPDHEKIAQWIVNQRQVQPITTTGQLVRLIFHAKGTTEKAWRKRAAFSDLHPAARTFQAIRILVNDELGSLRELLRVAPSCLRPGGRIGVISFHSGEDRLVKNAFREGLRQGVYQALCEHVVRPTQQETRSNPRSASAKFRWAQRA